jgi:hypothetical protein
MDDSKQDGDNRDEPEQPATSDQGDGSTAEQPPAEDGKTDDAAGG